MDYMNILKRAWKTLWSYRALWGFGIMLALTGSQGSQINWNMGSGNRNVGPTSGNNFMPPAEVTRQFDQFGKMFSSGNFDQTINSIMGIIIAVICVLFLLFIVFRIAHYVSQVAIISMVDKDEETGERLTWKQGFRLGWNRKAWRLFLIDLVVYLPFVIVVMALFGCAALPFLLSSNTGNQPSVPGIIATVGLGFVGIIILIIVGLFLSIVMNLIYRTCVLKGTGVIDSIREGWRLTRRNLKEAFIMWLLTLGVEIGFFILMIPVIILLLGLTLVIGGGSGYLAYTLVQASGSTPAWIAAGIVGGLFLLIITFLPSLILSGLKETFLSATWTLTYRELNVLLQKKDAALNDVNVPNPA